MPEGMTCERVKIMVSYGRAQANSIIHEVYWGPESFDS